MRLTNPAMLGGHLICRNKGVELAFWVFQLVKNPPAMQETRDRSLGLEDVLEKGKTTLSSILASLQYSGLENSMACIVHGVTKSQT